MAQVHMKRLRLSLDGLGQAIAFSFIFVDEHTSVMAGGNECVQGRHDVHVWDENVSAQMLRQVESFGSFLEEE